MMLVNLSESPPSKLDFGRSSFDDTEAEDEDDDLSESEIVHDRHTGTKSRYCFVSLCGILIVPSIVALGYYLMYIYVPVSRSPSYLKGLPTGIIQSGPLVGHTTHNSSKIWFYHRDVKEMKIIYWHQTEQNTDNRTKTLFYRDYKVEAFFSRPKVVDLIPHREANGAAMSTIHDLEADTKYNFEIRMENEPIAKGQFKTAPTPSNSTILSRRNDINHRNDTNHTFSLARSGTGISFKYLLASCMNVKSDTQGYKSQPVWDVVLKKNIDFALIPGDTVYMNFDDRDSQGKVKYNRVWFRNLQQRAESHFANFISKVPIYTSWDDHDYGQNDADHSQLGKENSLASWGHLWPNPYQGSSKGAGNYYSYRWGDVDYFVMDCRWYRNSKNGTLFGNSQMEWLSEKLIESTATFKIIVSASDVMERGMVNDLKELGKLVGNYSISGVLFNSGDIHRNQFKMQKVTNWPYPVVQITSSGIARVKSRPFAIITVDTTLEDPEVLTQFYIADSYDHITTWSNNATSDCHEIRKVKDRNMKQRCSRVVRLSELTPS